MLSNAEIKSTMEYHGVKPSPVRILVAKALSQASNPLSGLDLECMLATVDRSSITRALSLFVSSGMVHTIEDGSGSVKYELCHKSHFADDEDTDLHPHFYCMVCGRTFCLADQAIQHVMLPPGFTPLTANLVVKGICASCESS